MKGRGGGDMRSGQKVNNILSLVVHVASSPPPPKFGFIFDKNQKPTCKSTIFPLCPPACQLLSTPAMACFDLLPLVLSTGCIVEQNHSKLGRNSDQRFRSKRTATVSMETGCDAWPS